VWLKEVYLETEGGARLSIEVNMSNEYINGRWVKVVSLFSKFIAIQPNSMRKIMFIVLTLRQPELWEFFA
jgi:protein tyrosine phosphatase